GGRGLSATPSIRPGVSARRWACPPRPRPGRWMTSAVPGSACCAARSRSPPATATTRPPCSWRRPGSSNRSTCGWHGKPTWTPCRPRCSPGGWLWAADCGRWPRPPWPRPPHPGRAGAPDLLLDGLATLITAGSAAGAPLLKRAVAAFRGPHVPLAEQLRWLWLGGHAAGLVWDYESWDVLSARLVTAAAEAG